MASNYPKSSCRCYNCAQRDYNSIPDAGPPSNMSVRNCNISPYYDCYDKRSFSSEIQPTLEKGYVNLNPGVATGSYDKSFEKIACPDNLGGLCKNVYASTDPRLISSFHNGQVLTLDRPPITSEMKLNNINIDPSLNGYGQNYKTYSDINAGQIEYYINKSQEGAFFEPNFSSSARMFGTLYQDPMGSMKPQYDRQPLKCNNPLNTKNAIYDGGLSWIQDSQEHRQDLLSLQMRKRNQERFEPRWAAVYK